MKKILGLDLGTNSIGWAVIDKDDNGTLAGIAATGSRIIPMDAALLGDFAKGNTVSQTADRTHYRGARRLRERFLLRRERLLRVLDVMGFLPAHFSQSLTRYGKFANLEVEPKIAWQPGEDGKLHFVFMNAYDEMLADFREHHHEWLSGGAKVPYDWTIYYLRKKALTQALTPQELSWVLLNFNQKRGYYQLRGEEDAEDNGKLEEYMALTVVSVTDSGDRKGKDTWYNVLLDNGMVYRRTASAAPDWQGKVKEFIVTTQLDKDGKPKLDKDGNVKRSLRMPKEDDWALLKKKTEADIDRSGWTVGEYIYSALLNDPKQKIKGKLVRTVERRFYRDELHRILLAQKAFMPQLSDRELYRRCIEELYPSNEAYRASISQRDFIYLLEQDIIFYQRPLKSKKSLVDECQYERCHYTDKETGEVHEAGLKCIAKSHPLYQEFRLWQFVSNLRIYERKKVVAGQVRLDVDVTEEFLRNEDDITVLFDCLNDLSSIKQERLLEIVTKTAKPKKGAEWPYRWNYVEDKEYPCNTTRGEVIALMKKAGIDTAFLDNDGVLEALWHILYSVEDKAELRKALASFARRHSLGDVFVEKFARFKPFDKDYGAYSAKAIKRLLPLMRMGHYWSESAIDSATKDRIEKIINGECDDNIRQRTREKAITLNTIDSFRGLSLWLACYVVYDRHSEARDTGRWTSPDDIDTYLKTFRQHSLHNPIVEQVMTETLRTVRDIWKEQGSIDEIHIEMGREMKNPADKRRKMTEQITANENANMRAKILLTEMLNPELGLDIKNVRPYSPSQQELLRIYEDGAISNGVDTDEEIAEIMSRFSEADIKKRPTASQVRRYLLWMEQNYHSPYTGEMIPLAKLFTSAYEIEHVIPQSRFFDDSFSNKVICEAEVNRLKDNLLGLEFIKQHNGEKVQLSMGRTVTILSVEDYQRNVERQYKNSRAKMRKLLMDDIPDGFIERQLNDSRYICKLIKGLLSNVVRDEDEQEATSRNVITCTGSITDRLKKDWGLNDVWNSIILPRFKRLNAMEGMARYTTISSKGHEIPTVPMAMQRGFNKKRIDHRHHAMDAIVIACATRDHVNLLNNEAAMSRNNANRHQLSHKLRRYEEVTIERDGKPRQMSVAKEFIKPWTTFTTDVAKALRAIIVSFKHQQRVINKTSNKTIRIIDGRKRLVVQTKGDAWAVRKPMHKDTVYGEINLQRIKEVTLKDALQRIDTIVNRDLRQKLRELVAEGYNDKSIKKYLEDNRDVWADVNPKKIAVRYFTKETSERFFATRKPLSIFQCAKAQEAIKGQVADTAIQQILLRHLEAMGDPMQAFSPEGIENMNTNIVALNGGRPHQHIYKVRAYEKAEKFAVGQRGNRKKKFVEAAKGTNLFFAIYESQTIDKATGDTVAKRSFDTIPLRIVMERQKQGLPSVPDNENGIAPKYVLSPNDLVYLPTEKERKSGKISMPLDTERIYKCVSCDKARCSWIPMSVAKPIVDKYEFSPQNKQERAVTGEMIKEHCIPLSVSRLGEISFEKP